MAFRAWLPLAFSLVAGVAACARHDAATRDATVVARRNRVARALGQPAPVADSNPPLARWLLPAALSEVSGLELTHDGRLLAHDDERGRVTVIDPRGGEMIKRFTLADLDKPVDFEGIAEAHGMLYLLASNGELYEFREGANGARVPYVMLDTRLGHECEFEGLAFDPARGVLLMPCKNVHIKGLEGNLVIYRMKPGANVAPQLSRLIVPIGRIVAGHDWRHFHPAGIGIDPATGSYVLVAAREQALLELSPDGDVLGSESLPPGHPQAEGIAITRDGVLILGDEAVASRATLTLYRWPLAHAAEAP